MKRRRTGVWRALAVCLLLLGAALPVFAAEEGGEASRLTPAFQWINFAIVAGLIAWLLIKKTPAYFMGQANQIASGIEEAGKAKALADGQRREAEERLANLGAEIEELRAEARREMASEVKRMQAASREEAGKIQAAGRMEAEAAARGARKELRALAARLSIERAEAALRAEMTPAAEERMFARFLGELAGRPN